MPNPGGHGVPYVGREIRDLHDTLGTAARVRPRGWGRSSWQPALNGPRLGAARPQQVRGDPRLAKHLLPHALPVPLPASLPPAHPSALHDLSLEVLGGQDQDMDGLHEACAGAQDPARQTPLSPTCGAGRPQGHGAAALPAAPGPILPARLSPAPRPLLTSRSLPV